MPFVMATKSKPDPIKKETKMAFNPRLNCCFALIPLPRIYKLMAAQAVSQIRASRMMVVEFIDVLLKVDS